MEDEDLHGLLDIVLIWFFIGASYLTSRPIWFTGIFFCIGVLGYITIKILITKLKK